MDPFISWIILPSPHSQVTITHCSLRKVLLNRPLSSLKRLLFNRQQCMVLKHCHYMLDIVWHRLCHCVLLRYFIDQSSYFYLASPFTSCPNVFLFLKFTWYSYFPILTCKCLEFHLYYNEFCNSRFIIAVWLDLLYKFLFFVVQWIHHGLFLYCYTEREEFCFLLAFGTKRNIHQRPPEYL